MEFRRLAITFLLSTFLLSCTYSQSVNEEDRLEGSEGSGNRISDDEDDYEASALPPETSTERTYTPVKPKFTTKRLDEGALDVRITTKSTTATSTKISANKAMAKEKEDVVDVPIIKSRTKSRLPLHEVSTPQSVEFIEEAIRTSSLTPTKEVGSSRFSVFTWVIIVTVVAVVLIVVMVTIYIIKRRTGSKNAYKPGVPMRQA